MSKVITEELQAIEDAVREGGSLLIEAGAGSGKSTGLIHCSHYFPRKTIVLAFNKSVQVELEAKMTGFEVKTFHGAAFGVLRRRFAKVKVDANKYKQLAQALEPDLTYDDKTLVSDIISAFQLTSIGIELALSGLTFPDFVEVVSDADLMPTESLTLERAYQLAFEVFTAQLDKPTAYTFDDQLWYCVYFAKKKKWNLREYDLVVVDEAQDVSPIRLTIMKMLASRCIAVGDRRQGIYGFAGAMSDALDQIADAFNMRSLPLSLTWRCPTRVVDLANRIQNQSFLRARPNAPEGNIYEIDYDSLLRSDLDSRSMVLSRTNKPLIMLAVALLRNRIHFKILSDFAPKLIKKVERLLRNYEGGLRAFQSMVTQNYDDMVAKIESEHVKQRYFDERDTIIALAEECKDPFAVPGLLQRLIDSNFGVTLATGHKAKGLEAETVYVLAPDLIPAPWVSPEDHNAMTQERNLYYVITTRAKQTLAFVGCMPEVF